MRGNPRARTAAASGFPIALAGVGMRRLEVTRSIATCGFTWAALIPSAFWDGFGSGAGGPSGDAGADATDARDWNDFPPFGPIVLRSKTVPSICRPYYGPLYIATTLRLCAWLAQ